VDIAEMVCERCKFTSERIFRVITEVLALERDGAGLAETAERLVKAWENYREAAEWLRPEPSALKYISALGFRDLEAFCGKLSLRQRINRRCGVYKHE
jgi:hypothetical protein